jgi:hypothetical protein
VLNGHLTAALTGLLNANARPPTHPSQHCSPERGPRCGRRLTARRLEGLRSNPIPISRSETSQRGPWQPRSGSDLTAAGARVDPVHATRRVENAADCVVEVIFSVLMCPPCLGGTRLPPQPLPRPDRRRDARPARPAADLGAGAEGGRQPPGDRGDREGWSGSRWCRSMSRSGLSGRNGRPSSPSSWSRRGQTSPAPSTTLRLPPRQ